MEILFVLEKTIHSGMKGETLKIAEKWLHSLQALKKLNVNKSKDNVDIQIIEKYTLHSLCYYPSFYNIQNVIVLAHKV